MGNGLDVISLRGLSAVGRHGVYDFERSGSQVFTADITLYIDAQGAAENDDVDLTVDYGTVADAAVKILTGPPVYLLETLALSLTNMALEIPRVQKVTVTVHKPMAPVAHLFNDVSVTLTRTRKESPLTAAATERVDAESSAPPQLANLLIESPASPAQAEAKGADSIVLALGSNQGDPRQILSDAVAALIEAPGVEIDDVSPLVVTKPVLAPGQQLQPNYSNVVVVGRTVLTPAELLELTQSIENQFGRVRGERWGARTLDIDLIDVSGQVVSTPTLDLPHPRAAQRAFVLYPWSLLQPERVFAGRELRSLADSAPDRSGILTVQREWLIEDVPEVSEQPQPQKVDEEKPAAATLVTIRGNPVSLLPTDGDGIFQRLLQQELAPKPATSPRPAKKPVSPYPTRKAAAARQKPVPQPAPPSPVQPEAPLPKRVVPRQQAAPELPSWRFVAGGADVRIVDSIDSQKEQDEPGEAAGQRTDRTPNQAKRRVVRPTPTGMISLSRLQQSEREPGQK